MIYLRTTQDFTHSETNLLISWSKSLERNDQFWADLACHAHYVPYEWYQVMGHYCVLHLACCESESAVEHEQYLRMISPHGRG